MKRTGGGRGHYRTWPRRGGILFAVGASLATAIVIVVYALAAKPTHRFPGQYSFRGLIGFPTTVSISQAFQDHRLTPPPDIRGLKYSADSQAVSAPYPYPFAAVFIIPCTEVDGFLKANNLQYSGSGPDWSSPDVDVQLFAQEAGWHPSDEPARWYYNTQSYQGTPIAGDYQELMITGRTACTAYLWN
jgi:hypothetical protein